LTILLKVYFTIIYCIMSERLNRAKAKLIGIEERYKKNLEHLRNIQEKKKTTLKSTKEIIWIN